LSHQALLYRTLSPGKAFLILPFSLSSFDKMATLSPQIWPTFTLVGKPPCFGVTRRLWEPNGMGFFGFQMVCSVLIMFPTLLFSPKYVFFIISKFLFPVPGFGTDRHFDPPASYVLFFILPLNLLSASQFPSSLFPVTYFQFAFPTFSPLCFFPRAFFRHPTSF